MGSQVRILARAPYKKPSRREGFLYGARGNEAMLRFKDSNGGAGTMWSAANMVASRVQQFLMNKEWNDDVNLETVGRILAYLNI